MEEKQMYFGALGGLYIMEASCFWSYESYGIPENECFGLVILTILSRHI